MIHRKSTKRRKSYKRKSKRKSYKRRSTTRKSKRKSVKRKSINSKFYNIVFVEQLCTKPLQKSFDLNQISTSNDVLDLNHENKSNFNVSKVSAQIPKIKVKPNLTENQNRSVTHITELEKFQTKINNSTSPILVEFTANWCKPCKIPEKIAIDLIKNKNIEFVRFDVSNTNLDDIYTTYNIKTIPTFILFENNMSKKIIGKPNKSQIGVNDIKLEDLTNLFKNINA